MKRKFNTGIIVLYVFAYMILYPACSATKKIPEKTGIQLIEGEWKLESSSDDNALTGSVLKVYPETGDGLISFIQNNNYCLRPNEIIWKDITTVSNGKFSISSLANSCKSSLVYKEAVLTLIGNDEIKLLGRNADGAALTQTWKRIIVASAPKP